MSEITYYEDEIYKNSFQINQCQNYKELMKKWLKKEGKKKWKYVYYDKNNKKCENEIENPPYKDIDTIDDKCSYYKELTDFLNKQEEIYYKNKMYMYKYIAPNEYYEKHQKTVNGIIVCDYNDKDENEIFRLKSDQFGFMVGKIKDSKGNNTFATHPYGFLWELVKPNYKEFIATSIYQTRTLGGGFLWPKAICGERLEGYNAKRGGQSTSWANDEKGDYYIEDRVDLTLLEVKHLFELICSDRKLWDEENFKYNAKIRGWDYSDDILSKTIIETKVTKEEMEKAISWLRHFGSFEKYVEFFCFDDFVDKKKQWMPIDILESELLPKFDWDDIDKNLWDKTDEKLKGTKKILTQPTKYKNRKEHSIFHTDRTIGELIRMLNNVRYLTLARSYRMQEIINDAGKE